MRFLKRSTEPEPDGVPAFWAWWEDDGRALVSAALAARDPQRVVGPLSQHVQKVHDGLAWELAAGRDSEHLLVVSAEGNPELRAVARRWLREAPPPDRTWSYADFRQPTAGFADTTLELGGVRFRLGDVKVSAESSGAALDVRVHHAALASLPEAARIQVAFLVLDGCLGEETVETWIGEVGADPDDPARARSVVELPDLVREHRAQWVDDEGEPVWALLQAQTPRGPLIASVRQPLRAAVAPLLDAHVVVTLSYSDRTEVGFPGPEALASLRALEDHVTERLGDAALLVAHETCAGRRTWHLYAEHGSPVPDMVQAAVGGWTQGKARVEMRPDPGWKAVAHLR
jgi:hypothetical protein